MFIAVLGTYQPKNQFIFRIFQIKDSSLLSSTFWEKFMVPGTLKKIENFGKYTPVMGVR